MRSLSVIVRWTCSQCPEHLRLTRCMPGSSPAANQVHRTSMDVNWTSTRQGMQEFQTKKQNACQCIATIHPAGAFFWWSPFQVLCCKNLSALVEQTSPDKEPIRRMRNGQETQFNAYGWRRTNWKFCCLSDVCQRYPERCDRPLILRNLIVFKF